MGASRKSTPCAWQAWAHLKNRGYQAVIRWSASNAQLATCLCQFVCWLRSTQTMTLDHTRDHSLMLQHLSGEVIHIFCPCIMYMTLGSCLSSEYWVFTLDWLIASQWTYPQACKGLEHVAELPPGSLATTRHHLAGRKGLPVSASQYVQGKNLPSKDLSM